MILPKDASTDQSNCPNGYYRNTSGMVMQVPANAPEPTAPPLSAELELFCKAYVSSGDSTQAWKAAFREDGDKKAIKALLSQPDVDKRITILMNKRLELMQHSAQVDIDLLVRELEQARQLAIKNDEPAAAISATMGKAKLHGLLVDKREITTKTPEQMTEAELLKALGFNTVEELMAAEGMLVIEHQPNDKETALN